MEEAATRESPRSYINYMKGITNETNQIIHTTSKRYW